MSAHPASGRSLTPLPGIAPTSVPWFVVAPLGGAVLAAPVVAWLYGRPVTVGADTAVINPAASDTRTPARSP
jgi:hypothetical protein